LSIGLACKLTRSHAPQILTVRTYKGHSLLGQLTGKRETLGANQESADCIRENNEIIRKAINSL